MKKIIMAIISIMLLLMMNSVFGAEAAGLTATLSSYNPQPASPGNYVTVYVKLENNGTAEAKNVILKLLPEIPFSISDGSKTEENIGTIGAKGFHVAEFRVRVDENTIEGTNYLKVSYNANADRTVWATQELPITIQTLDAVLAITKVTTSPEEIIPGEKATIQIELENLADSRLTDITVDLDLSATTTPLAPFGSASKQSVYQMRANEKRVFTFDVIAEPDAISDVYKIPINLTYYDNSGTEYAKSDLFGIIINSEPEISVMIDSTSLMSEQKVGNIIIKIVNKGLSDVKLMNLKLIENDDYEILSSTNEEYLGNIDSDDFETVEFDLYLKGEEEIIVQVELEYRDNTNKQYTESFNLNLKIHSAKKLGNGKGNGWTYFIVIIVVIAGIWYYRRKKNKQHK